MNEPIENPDSSRRREEMVARQIVARGVHDPRVLDAMRAVPREDYVPPHMRRFAYDDSALAIAEGQTISQPFIVAYMLEAMELQPLDRALEVGTGSGYGAALLGELVAEVHTIERIPRLASAADERLRRAGYDNVHVHLGDGTLGLPDDAPFDAIVVTAGGPLVPPTLRRQLTDGGRLVMPIGGPGDQVLVRVRRNGLERWDRETLTGCRFVPLIGAEGWRD